MPKLRFDNLTISQFSSFKLVPKKHRKENSDKKLMTNLVKGVCIKEGDEYFIEIDTRNIPDNILGKNHPNVLKIPFTEESYNLKGIVQVFSRTPDKNGRYTRFIRNESQCKFFPGNRETLVPFCNNWICSGYLVRRDGKIMLDFNECITPKGYAIVENKEEE